MELAIPGECDICKDAVKVLDSFLLTNKTESALLTDLEKACKLLPSSDQDECVSFLDQFGSAVIDYIETLLQPDSLCSSLGLCKLFNKAAFLHPDDECAICGQVIDAIDTLLENPSTQEAIINSAEGLCTDLPGVVQGLCKTLIEQFGSKAIDWLARELNPTTVCKDIHACK